MNAEALAEGYGMSPRVMQLMFARSSGGKSVLMQKLMNNGKQNGGKPMTTMYPSLSADTDPRDSNGRFSQETLKQLHDDAKAALIHRLSNSEWRSTQGWTILIGDGQAKLNEYGNKGWPWINSYAESSGTGCCGIPVLLRLGYLYPKGKPTRDYPSGCIGMTPQGPVDWKTFRWAVAQLLQKVSAQNFGYKTTQKLVMATLTKHQINQMPYLLDILEYLDFEVAHEFVNTGSGNRVTVFHKCSLGAYQPAPQEEADAALKRMRQRREDRIATPMDTM